MNLDLKEKGKLFLLFGIFGVIILILYYSLLLKPLFSRFIANNRGFYTVRARVRQAEALIASGDRLKREYESLGKQSELVEKKFLRHDEVSSLLEGFSDIAESSGVKILKIKPLEAAENVSRDKAGAGLYTEYPILIEAMAGYHQCGMFINKLENMGKFIKLVDIDISSRGGDPRRHDIKLKVTTYVMQQISPGGLK